MEIFPGVHRIEVHYHNRYLFQHILVGTDNLLFIDSGVAATPMEAIGPYVDKEKIVEEQSPFLLVTHGDSDHSGGNAALKTLFPKLKIMAHRFDSENIEDPNQLLKNRYNELEHLGLAYSEEKNKQSLKNMGEKCSVDIALAGEESFRLSADWKVQLQHSPGHTKGHMMVYDPKNRMAIVADAILGKGVPAREGGLALCPTNRYPGMYLETITEIEALDIDHLLTSHFPLISGKEEIARFVAESREFVAMVDAYILNEVEKEGSVSVRSLIDHVGKKLGDWPEEKNFDLFYCLQGGLEELARQGMVKPVENGQEIVWQRRD
ncbi:glyoxylase-like metal-dependent hydrolase (beta-lactamase superfamily II) [Planomicrobium soli]|uniref:Glyoxylase-like metal-dependent hydrolase (Beta-lactamase superfamily II) n=1 Tax=Planomicrobium soli TaxID=1176648 RepID=A0A2P8H3D8_9BACL|nr:MBL fold metallo-hydrolase [Planomicrobium soli]PSL40727.1 glyoxylase-like metal-dependent hydrolase (beta-lactamase superfamily II) [Planomicrobium soli]